MIGQIFLFELKQQLRQPLFWIAGTVLFLLTFGAITTDAVQVGGAIGNVNRNAPFVIMQILMVMSVIGVFVTTAFVAGAVLRDFDYRTHELFFTTPMSKGAYLFGRLGGAFVAAALVFLFVILAIMIGSAMPWLEPERVGPFALMPYLFSFGAIVLPNLFVMSAAFFALATLSRSIMATYVGLVTFFLGYNIAGFFLQDLENQSLAAIVDPYGVGAFGLVTRYWTTAERNTMVMPLSGDFLTNRLVWTGVALLFLALTYWRFSFSASETWMQRRRRRRLSPARGPAESTEPSPIAGVAPLATAPRAEQDFTRSGAWSQYLYQARTEIWGVARSLPFLILLALGVLNVWGGSTTVDQLFGTPVYPVTHLMLQMIQSTFLLWVILILTFYAGELVWKERQSNFADVHDALPAPSWVFWGAKFTALLFIVFAVLAVAGMTGVVIQFSRGYPKYEILLYIQGLFGEVGLQFIAIAVLAFLSQVLFNHKFAAYLTMVVYFVSLISLNALGFEHRLYQYGTTPGAPYSDMNRWGHFFSPVFWFTLYWILGAAILMVLAHVFWVRGRETNLGTRLRLAGERFSRPARRTAIAFGLAFVATGAWIFYNTNVLNAYVTSDERQDRQARYETDYKRYEDLPQPTLTAVYADVDIFPAQRSVDIRGRYTLVNQTDGAIDQLHVTMNPVNNEIRDIVIPGAVIDVEDLEVGYRIFRFDSPLAPGDGLVMTYRVEVRNPGFANSGSNTNVVFNGTFFNSSVYFPHIGYGTGFELGDPNERRKRELPPLERLPDLDDPTARARNYISGESHWIDFETVVSTSDDQIALAPGYLQREWTEGGRKFYHYKMDAPILGFWAYLSGRWDTAQDTWNDVDIVVYHHPGHEYNVERMIDGVKKSLDYFTENFGPYQHRQVRIVEFPRYASFAQSFPNTIPFSESIGFIARLDDEDDAIDYPFYVTAHEVAHQWWAHQVIGANAQGSTVLSETMSQYSALMVMEKEYGPELMRRFLKYELESYLTARGGELIEELPLLRVENQGYVHYRKGSLVMYALRDYVGEEPLNHAIRRFRDEWAFKGPPYPTTRDFMAYIEEVIPEDRTSIVEDLFETITLYDNQATDATLETLDDGTYRLTLNVESTKYRADGQGTESEVPMNDWVDVAVFGDEEEGAPPEGRILYLEKHHITEGESVIEILLTEEPQQAGVDAFNKLIDRNPGNNVVTVSN